MSNWRIERYVKHVISIKNQSTQFIEIICRDLDKPKHVDTAGNVVFFQQIIHDIMKIHAITGENKRCVLVLLFSLKHYYVTRRDGRGKHGEETGKRSVSIFLSTQHYQESAQIH